VALKVALEVCEDEGEWPEVGRPDAPVFSLIQEVGVVRMWKVVSLQWTPATALTTAPTQNLWIVHKQARRTTALPHGVRLQLDMCVQITH
jgi:hypothetical protein